MLKLISRIFRRHPKVVVTLDEILDEIAREVSECEDEITLKNKMVALEHKLRRKTGLDIKIFPSSLNNIIVWINNEKYELEFDNQELEITYIR